MKIDVKITVGCPRVPCYLITSDNKPIQLCAVTDSALNELAEQWRINLLARAAEQHKLAYGTERVEP